MRQVSALLFALLSCGGEVIPLGRQDIDIVRTTCLGGVNQNPETQTADECDDVLNVWAPNGRVETRPGYTGIIKVGADTTTATIFKARAEDVSGGTFTSPGGTGLLTLNSLVGRTTSGGDQDRWYLGHSAKFNSATIVVSNTNSNSTRFKAEYWNGSEWKYLHVEEWGSTSTQLHLSASTASFLFVDPQDWATTTVDSQSAYWIRFNLLDASFDSSVEIDVDNASTTNGTGASYVGYFSARFPTQKRYISVLRQATLNSAYYLNAVAGVSVVAHSQSTNPGPDEPATMALVPQFEEAFIAYNHFVSRHSANPTSSDTLAAQVETDDFAVGDNAPYDDAYIAQLSTFPKAKYLQFFKGRLWAANLQGEPYTVRWSAPQPYHKVWPQLSYEVLAEHDNSPITGMHPLGEYMVIFKRDSIWMAYDGGLDAFGLQSYAIRQVVNGVGCVSNGSIKAIRGNLIFLAEDGIYSFNGAGVTKLSDKVNTTISNITAGRRPFAAAAHWRTENLYLLSFTTDGSSAHDTTLAWDYVNDTWWIWDNIDAQFWGEDENVNDDETLYFVDSSGRIFEFGVGLTDNGGTITSTLTTSRLGFGSSTTLRARHVWVMGSNKSRSVTAELLENDASSGASTTISFVDSGEADWSDFSYASGASTDDNYTVARRRLKRSDYRRDGDWLQVKLTHNQKNQPLALSYIDIGLLPLGRSRG